jgi:hypothetical protein
MLKVSKRLHLLVVVAMTLTAAAFAGSVAAGSALADDGHQWDSPETPPTLSGDWAGLNRCPVDNPTMLAADGVTNIALCLAVTSPNGSLTIGGLTLPTKASNLQAGVVINETGQGATLVSPADGAAENESIEVPNGLQALICPSSGRLAWRVCRPPRHDGRDYEHSSQLTNLTVSMVQAGEPSNFNLFAGLSLNQPLLSLPVKIHLQNRLLGNRCYIGSDAEPIIIQPENTTAPTVKGEEFDGNGTPDPNGPLTKIQLADTQGSSSFAVPAATGCGFMGIFDEAIDNHMSLPSAAGKNSLVFNEAKTEIVALTIPEGVAPNDGQELSKAWHSAVQPEEENEGRHHRHGH